MPWKTPPLKRSYPCNSERLVFTRERRGLTQRQLADRAGYSERLVSKAESGQSISTETIDNLAEALSTSDEPVYPEDLIADPVALAKQYITAIYTMGKDCVDGFAHFLDEEIVFRIAGDPAELPFAGEHRGEEAIRRAFGIFFSILEAPKNHDPLEHYSFICQGDEVTMTGASWIHPIGAPMEKPIMLMHRIVFRRGKLVLMEDIFDTMAGKQALDKSAAKATDDAG